MSQKNSNVQFLFLHTAGTYKIYKNLHHPKISHYTVFIFQQSPLLALFKLSMHIIIIILLINRRVALGKWKEHLGWQATYKNLMTSFEEAGYHQYADLVRRSFTGK